MIAESPHSVHFRLPLPGWPRASFETDYGYRGGRLVVGGVEVLRARDREALQRGLESLLPSSGRTVSLRLDDRLELTLAVDGAEAPREDKLSVPPSRSAWSHGWIALAASVFGFIASYLYLLRARETGEAWPMKMAIHTAGWHALLVLTLFPASVWGQRTGIRIVQLVSFVFFCIHVGMAFSNAGGSGIEVGATAIALFNALSGLSFLAATAYGNRAHRDMNPLRHLESSPVEPANSAATSE